MNKLAVITGVNGQDGSYLTELLLDKNYTVVGLYRRTSLPNFSRIQHLLSDTRLILEECDIADPTDCLRVISKYKPDELYNLAAQSHVATSFNQPSVTFDINTKSVINLLECVKTISKHTRFYQASTSEMFGDSYTETYISSDQTEKYQDENTVFSPQSPYAISKLASHRLVQIYRQSYDIFACSGILFNHESPRRGYNFVTRKITKYIGGLYNQLLTDKLKLGNIYAFRDWGHAKDFVYAMWLMLQQDEPDDYVISTGITHTVQEFLQASFNIINLDYKEYIEIDPSLFRPSEVKYLKGNYFKAKNKLGWEPSVSFDALVREMVNSDIRENHNQI